MVQFKDIAREYRATYRGNMVGVPIVGLEHIEPYDMLLKKWDTDVETTFTKTFKKGQILLGRRRAYQHKACVATCDGICSGDITVIEPIEGKIYPDLLPFIIQNDNFFEHAIKGSNGALSPRVKWEHMANYEFSLPSLAEQKILADKLWAAYEVKQSYLNMIDATNQMVKAKFIEMLGGGKYPTKPISELFILQMGKTPERKNPNNFAKDGYIWLSIADMNDYQIYIESSKECLTELGVESCGIKIVPANTLIMSFKLTVGRVAITKKDLYTNEAIMAFLPKNNEYLLKFQYYLFKNTNWLIDAKQAVKGNTLNKESISKVEIPLIPKKNQQSFVAVAEQAESTISALNQSIVAIDKVIRSLINENL